MSVDFDKIHQTIESRIKAEFNSNPKSSQNDFLEIIQGMKYIMLNITLDCLKEYHEMLQSSHQ